MNILFVTSSIKLFSGISFGAEVRSTLFVKALSQIGHVDVVSFCKETVVSNIANCKVIYSSYIPKVKINSLLKRIIPIIIRPWSPYSYYQLNTIQHKIIQSVIENGKYDLVACRYLSDAISCGLLDFKSKLIIDIDDNPVTAYKRDRMSISSNHGKGTLFQWYKALNLGIMSRRVLRGVKCSFYSNPTEPPYNQSVFLHNVSLIKANSSGITIDFPNRILFVGWLDYLPNKNGILHFVEKIFPTIKANVPDVELIVIGKTEDQSFINYLNSFEGIYAPGFVEDINEEYKKCRVIIIPIYQGSGTCIKFIEGMRVNRPIVSTPMGARGFDRICRDGVHYMRAESDFCFAMKVTNLLNSIELSNQIAMQAMAIEKEFFSFDHFCNIVRDALCE